jgi:hypothetical protein
VRSLRCHVDASDEIGRGAAAPGNGARRRFERRVMGALCGVILASGCGRLGFEIGGSGGVDGGGDGDASALDDTICDEIAGLLLCEPLDGTASLPTVHAFPPNTLEFDTSRRYRGLASQHSHTETSSSVAWRLGQRLGRITTGDLHARWYMYMPSSITQPIASIHLLEDTMPFHGVAFGVNNGRPEVAYTGGGTAASSAPMPRDRWTCVQVHVLVDPSAGLVEFWIDGVLSGRVDALNTLPATGYNNVHIGHFSGGAPHTEIADVWTDEVAIGTFPIPCD